MNLRSVLKALRRLFVAASLLFVTTTAEYLQEFEVSEGVPIGTTIGHIGQSTKGHPSPPPPPYLIVPVPGSAVDSDLYIDQSSGEIRTNVVLDRELRNPYSFVAIPLSGENVRVIIRVKDENDNAPEFPSPYMNIEFPENTPRDVKRTLHPARDKDLGIFNTQRYSIVSGNINNAFRLSSHRERDDVLYLDLQINGFLDRETTPFYSLLIEAYDGGVPPLKGSMTVNVTIQDVNDNQPIFNQSRYFATIAENATIGTSVLRVFATDTDAGDNGRITYLVNRRQRDKDSMFTIDPRTGVISVNKPLDFEAKDVHELVVVARDNGAQPLETTAFVSIRITDVNDNQPTINLIFLSDDATPKISEDARPGEFVARISVNDPDSREEYANVNVTLRGGDGHFGLTTQDNIIYLVIVSHPLDREVKPNYTMVVTATDQGSPPLNTSRSFQLKVTDTNDNAPEFDHTVYYANVLEVADPGTSVFQLSAVDRDEGNNSMVTYSIKDTPETHSNWFHVDANTGLITTKTHIDCETNPIPQIIVVATDAGHPPLSSSATVIVTISDVNDNEPIFDQSFYNVTVLENEKIGTCILKISATDPDCGVNAMVNYTIAGGSGAATQDFVVHAVSGNLCIASSLDYETRSSYEIPVMASDRGGLSTTAMIKVHVIDVNDNRPIFYPREYNVSLREHENVAGPIVVVAATDADSGLFGHITYSIVEGNDKGLFRIDRNSGEIFVQKQLNTHNPIHFLTIEGKDGDGLTSLANAYVYVSVISINQQPPVFEQAYYKFSVREDVPPETVVGTVMATSADPGLLKNSMVRYSIYSGDPEGYFFIDPVLGTISTRRQLDHEKHPFLLLNVQATSGQPPSYGQTQVNLTIWDVNDNPPKFTSSSLKISVPENTDLSTAIYVAYAEDPDSGDNGAVHYQLAENPDNSFKIDRKTGTITLMRLLDFELQHHYQLKVHAIDSGVPPQSSTLVLDIEIQDVNDNAPFFEKNEYKVNVLESLPANSQFLQVTASDKDTGNNARLTFKLKDTQYGNKFGIFPNSGFLYLKNTLDRETMDQYVLHVIAVDNGSPPLSATATVSVQVLDANDNDPRFLQKTYTFTVEENKEKGRQVGTVSARDKDLGNNASLRYSLLNTNGSFQINPITGEIFTTSTLDRETHSSYELTAEVRDQGSPSRYDHVVVHVMVTDMNDNAPVFVEPVDLTVTVREEQPIGTEVVVVKATDPDAGNNATVYYELLKGPEDIDGYNAFAINSLTGSITTREVLDHEQQRSYILTVLAKDGGVFPLSSQIQLQVQVLDLNDNQPMFPLSSVSFRISEGVPIGYELGVVQAQDQDGGENGRVSYSIISGNIHGVFDVGRITGSLFTVASVDYEMAQQYLLQIHAVDNSNLNPQSSLITVKIEIDDINDNPPIFRTDPVVFSISENTPQGTLVWNFSAIDNDGGVNGQVKYTLSEQSPASAFKIDSKTGRLTLVQFLDYEEYAEYTLIITAEDQAADRTKRLASSVTCKIIIEDENDNFPKFTSQDTVHVLEDEPIGYPLLHVIAVDADSRDNARITYTITNGNKGKHFHLDADTGLLTISRPLDREDIQQFVLNVTASDHGRPSHSSYQLINIFVEDVNDNAPEFEHKVYRANISEASRIGTFVAKVKATDKDLGANGNLTYLIPQGVTNKFMINSLTGEIRTTALLDREETESYSLSVYVRDAAYPSRYDMTTVIIDVMDINDHNPEFGDSCYPLQVPENRELGVIHTLIAADRDANQNAELTYTITDGNIDNKFSVDLHTGQLSCRPLDREQLGQYNIIIVARDQGRPSRSGVCNLTVIVLDQNDNDPYFDLSEYNAVVSEDAPINTTVLVVRAQDRDQGVNGKITYSLNNETLSLFSIDSETGVVKTTGTFDREKKSSYIFEVKATDGGRYDARSEKALLYISVGDINDNKPIFTKYPFVATINAHASPGMQVIRIQAEDKDEGANAEISYSFGSNVPFGKFHLDPESGIVTVAGNLAPDAGKVFRLEIIARDKGRPPLMTSGILEINVGEQHSSTNLQFENLTYIVPLPENSPKGVEVTRVRARHPTGETDRITYSFAASMEDGSFQINPKTGIVSVRDPRWLDYETTPELKVVVIAQADNSKVLYGYATIVVKLLDQNDNPPHFSQSHYVSSVWEGNNKGTFVTQVSATDADQGSKGNVMYHILDGNHDNAFVIDPPFSGIVKTNIVLDREIRDTYYLTVVASDDGIPQLSSTCTLRINIIDVNDNQPVFPPHNFVTVSEGSKVGAVITTITANDVDTNPSLTYSFTTDGNPNNVFSIDRFSGRITLAASIDHETQKQYRLQVQASDSAHLVETSVIVNVTDINDNPPVFEQQTYQVIISESLEPGSPLVTVTATDLDSGDNALIRYSLVPSNNQGFSINSVTGTIYTNQTLHFDLKQPIIQLTVMATDKGTPPLSSFTSVHVQLTGTNRKAPSFTENKYRVNIPEDAPRGSTLLKVSATDVDDPGSPKHLEYSITNGNIGEAFGITSGGGDLILMRSLDRENISYYNLQVIVIDHGKPPLNATTSIDIYVEDVNDNPPVFNQSNYEAFISELSPVGIVVLQVAALDSDEGPNAQVMYDITSGNHENKFHLDAQSGTITLKGMLDYDTVQEYRFIVRASDSSAERSLSALATVTVKVQDENDNAPHFPVLMYTEVVEENAPVGTSVFTAHAVDGDRGAYGNLNYSITEGDGKDKFRVDPDSGVVTTKVVFDYETNNHYSFILIAQDAGGKHAGIKVQVDIESKDEFPPEFTENTYRFIIPGNAPVGYVVGKVTATDRDGGRDGRVIYHLRASQPYLQINSTTGVITVKSPIRPDTSNRKSKDSRSQNISLVVHASSGLPNSLSSMVVIEIGVDYSLNATEAHSIEGQAASTLPGWGLGLVICLAILAIILMSMIVFLRVCSKRTSKPAMVQGFESSFDTIDIHHPPSSPASLTQFPPHYSDIAHFESGSSGHINAATSEVSDQSHSASSGRGSAEDGEDVEDEEICMINDGSLLHQQKVQRLGISDIGMPGDEDNLSDISIQNTQEYLARLGINTTTSEPRNVQEFNKVPNISNAHSVESMHMFDDEGGGESSGVDIGNLIYSKLGEVDGDENGTIIDGPRAFGFGDGGEPSMTGSLSSIVHSEEELTGSYNWDYLLDWGPQYQPLAHVFAEIARLKDDGNSSNYGAGQFKKNINASLKTAPPVITNMAPSSNIAPVALSSGHSSQVNCLPSLPRSPISHESNFSSPAMSPSFSPSLSPLATRSPSISPLMACVASGNVLQMSCSATPHQSRSQRSTNRAAGSSGSETEMHI